MNKLKIYLFKIYIYKVKEDLENKFISTNIVNRIKRMDQFSPGIWGLL